MTRTRFQQGLDELKEKLLVMGGLAEQAVDRAVDGFRKRDAKLFQQVFDAEESINKAEREIDELALDLLAMQQPMAVDLRFITACMKINADLERVGDQAVNIAQRGAELISLPQVDLPVDIPRMASTVAGMVRRALEAFIAGNAELAEAVLKMDDIVDRMDDDIYITLVEKMHKSPDITSQALDAILISRNLERVADHATNIAEDVIFWVRGADVRHGGDHFKSFSGRS
jgi:phosphate transport system protein